MTIEYTFDLAVRNVERLNVSRFVTGVHMFQPRYYLSSLELLVFIFLCFILQLCRIERSKVRNVTGLHRDHLETASNREKMFKKRFSPPLYRTVYYKPKVVPIKNFV